MSDEIELIKERLDIAEIIGEHVNLKRAGGHFKGLCPFHQEKTPSFIVSPDKGIWHCFGCGDGGDILSFIQRIDGTDFPTTLKSLAERAGVELSNRPATSQDQRTQLYEVMELAARFYHEILINQAAGKKAKTYLNERGVKPKACKEFQIGYAPGSWDLLQRYLQSKKIDVSIALAAGLVGKNQNGKYYDRFRGRIMFPIHNVQGKVVAFGGRITPWHTTGQEGKYVNSPETTIYKKGSTVYNLNRAKTYIRQQKIAIIVEGYLDVVMLAQAGILNVVASSGTAFTAQQITLLNRFADELHFSFDADSAGIKAANDATQEALLAGLRVAMIEIPDGSDPADLALKDSKKLMEIINTPTTLISVLLKKLKKTDNPNTKSEVFEQVLPLVNQVSNPIQQGEMIMEIANTLHLPEAKVIEHLERMAGQIKKEVQTEADKDSTSTVLLTLEQQILGFIINQPSLRTTIMNDLKNKYFIDEAAQNLYTQLLLIKKEKNNLWQEGPDSFIAALEEHQKPFAEGLRQLADERHSHDSEAPDLEAKRLVLALKHQHLKRQLNYLQELMAKHSGKQRMETLKKFQAIAEQLANNEEKTTQQTVN